MLSLFVLHAASPTAHVELESNNFDSRVRMRSKQTRDFVCFNKRGRLAVKVRTNHISSPGAAFAILFWVKFGTVCRPRGACPLGVRPQLLVYLCRFSQPPSPPARGLIISVIIAWLVQ